MGNGSGYPASSNHSVIAYLPDTQRLTVRGAEARTGIAAADFSRIRKAKLDRFTIDRLMRIRDGLNRNVRVRISVSKRAPSASRPASLAA